MNVLVIFEDKDVLVVNKPAGLVVHSDGKTDESTLADWILEQYPEMKDVGEPFVANDGTDIVRPGIVHRLDRDTSGVLVIAKNQKTFEHLKKQFQAREVQKMYNAFVHGTFKDHEGIIDRPIGKSRSDFRRWSAQPGARGEMRDAITNYKVLQSGKDDEKVPHTFSFLEVKPKTGRTHQIRVHFKAIHHPVVCDALYAPKRPCALGFKRLALHARMLTFALPDGATITAEVPLPEDFVRALSLLAQ